ncbi:MAG: type II toxin-antitoxin system RatA family toxin [Pseudomonadales bacterium]|nr:type II toxin-antitoxin system RatA family toxin [Pseudomonadales bacterium]
MSEVRRSALIALPAETMFDVVSDVPSYPKFLPWCTDAKVLSESAEEVVARLTIEKGGISQSFTTRNVMERPGRIHLSLVDGPFSHFAGEWRFEALGDAGSKVSLELDFDFESRMLNLAFGKVWAMVADRMVDAFCERAEALRNGR